MPKYAYFNPVANPAPVLSWIDGDDGEWPNLPSSDYLLEITDAQWAARTAGEWQVQNRNLVPVPASDVSTLRDAKLAQLDADYHTAIQADVAYMGTTFQADVGSQDTLTKTLAAISPSGNTPTNFFWIDTQNVPVAMTLAQLQGLASAMMGQGWAAFQHLQDLKTQARSATTPAQLAAITW